MFEEISDKGDFTRQQQSPVRMHLRIVCLILMLPVAFLVKTGAAAPNPQGYRLFSSPSTDPNVYEEDLRIAQKILLVQESLGQNSLLQARAMINLADLYEKGGYIELALPLYEKALMIFEIQGGAQATLFNEMLDRIARIYKMMGDVAHAFNFDDKIYREYDQDLRLAQKILEQQEKNLGPDHYKIYRLHELVGSLHKDLGHYPQALSSYTRVKEMMVRQYGLQHPRLALIWEQLGFLYRQTDNFLKARHAWYQAFLIWKKYLGDDHPKLATALKNLSYIHIDIHLEMIAAALAREAQAIDQKSLQTILSFGSEQQRLEHMAHFDPYSLPATIGDTPAITRAVLDNKGIVLDSLIEDLRRVRDRATEKESRILLNARNQKKKRLMRLLWNVSGGLDREQRYSRQRRIERLKQEIQSIEQQFAQRDLDFGQCRAVQSVKVEDIQQALGTDTALIEFIVYNHYVGHNQFEKRYGALLFVGSQPPQWLPLEGAGKIHKAIKRYQIIMRQDTYDDHLTRTLLTGLYEMLWRPLEEHFPSGIRRVVISPAGYLNYLSFATLLAPRNQFLAHKYEVHYVPFGRDLSYPAHKGDSKNIYVFADPAFADSDDEFQRPFYRLPGTRLEAEYISLIAREQSFPLQSFFQDQANEETLAQLKSPHILHLATHGFFKNNEHIPSKDADPQRPFLVDRSGSQGLPELLNHVSHPMHTSGLALAGAQESFNRIVAGTMPLLRSDGLVTAEEISLLDLNQTWLVVLSVCDAGLVDIRSGDEFMGLRRGFMQAGAQNLLLSLWQVDDRLTPDFMRDFYQRLFQSQNSIQAFTATQRYWLGKYLSQKGLHYAVKHAGSFVLFSQGHP